MPHLDATPDNTNDEFCETCQAHPGTPCLHFTNPPIPKDRMHYVRVEAAQRTAARKEREAAERRANTITTATYRDPFTGWETRVTVVNGAAQPETMNGELAAVRIQNANGETALVTAEMLSEITSVRKDAS